MLRLIFTSTLLAVLVSCNSQDKKSDGKTRNGSLEKIGSQFLDNLYNRRYQMCIASMDDTVIAVAKDINLDSAFVGLSNKIRNEYGGQITSTLVSSEKTFHENLPATFLIFKVETSTKFGYYFFYISDKSNRIFLVSEFSRIKPKRT
jgi:nitrogenase subunit NifH